MKNRKGFTIVELVIVIAVIAILAAVLIPTFSGIVGNANQSAALQTARSTLTNALNMSSTASLAGTTASGVDKTVIVTEGYAFKYTGNALEARDFPTDTTALNGNKAASAKDSDKTYNFNALLIASDNLVINYAETTGLTVGTTDVSDYFTKDGDNYVAASGKALQGVTYYEVTAYIEAALGQYIAEASNITCKADDNKAIEVTYKAGHYYVGYDAGDYIAEVFINGDFSKKVVVFTTFG